MKTKACAIFCFALLVAMITGCSSLKASFDNATVKKDWHYNEKGKLTDDPVASVPIWSSKGLKEKPVDVTPPKN